MDDLPRRYVIRESSHRIHNPFSDEKLATLGRALSLSAGTSVLDLACGSGEMLCTWARDHELTGTGVDISTAFIGSARAVPSSWMSRTGLPSSTGTLRATSLNGRWVSLPASGRPGSGTAWPGRLSCCGAASAREASCWSANRTGVGEPPDQATAEGCDGIGHEDWLPLPELIESFGPLGCDVVEMVLADQDSWDRYVAASWLNIRRWLDANPHDELADEMRAELASDPARHARYRREYLGWGVFALMNR